MWFTPLTRVEKHAWNFRLGVIQASLLMDDLFTDDCFIKNAHSSILGDHGRPLWMSLELGYFIVHHHFSLEFKHSLFYD